MESSIGMDQFHPHAPHARRNSKIQLALEALRRRRQETIMELLSKPQKIESVHLLSLT